MASASAAAGRVSGWLFTPMRPAAFASACRAAIMPLFSQCTPVIPPASFKRRRIAKMVSSSTWVSYVMYSLKEDTPSAIMSSISRLTAGFQSVMDMWKP